MVDNKISNNKGFRYILVIFDNFSKSLWAIPLKNKYSKTITNELSNILLTSKRSPLKLESYRGSEWCNSIFQNFLKVKIFNNIQDSQKKDHQLLKESLEIYVISEKKPVFLAEKADRISELPSVIKQIIIQSTAQRK